jgi:alpha-L-fucosidase
MKRFLIVLSLILIVLSISNLYSDDMVWWREARLGLFIHWGLYAVPAGEWNGEKDHAEWIRETAEIPIDVYNQFVHQFNPVKFDADEWVRLAKEAGMKYIVITSKHHDGFCLFDSKHTDFDIMYTPFKRDILRELADAAAKEGIKLCWYHSIMDWHHPDYIPRRKWEEKDRPLGKADFDRYIAYMKNQLAELVNNYGDIGVLWFDGEWEDSWNHPFGKALYSYVKNLQPNIIINNRVDKGRSGMAGMTKEGEYFGDFGTPEQEIPGTGLPGMDWETCMTMNDHWGYNKNDSNWKSTKDLLQKLADIASKGGNFLLNIGPTAEGRFPNESITRLKGMGDWMKIYSESIYGTQASPFKNLSWGRCTQRTIYGGTRLYLHVFDWPDDGKLVVPGILNQANSAYLLADPRQKLDMKRNNDALVITVPAKALDESNTVVVLDINGSPNIVEPPEIKAEARIFMDEMKVSIFANSNNTNIHYTLDDSDPVIDSPLYQEEIIITETTTVSARIFSDSKPVSATIKTTFIKVNPPKVHELGKPEPGLKYDYYEGDWKKLPDFNRLKPIKSGIASRFGVSLKLRDNHYGFVFTGYLYIPKTGNYTLSTISNDGSKLYLNDNLLINNDGEHGMKEVEAVITLQEGLHPIKVTYFQTGAGNDLKVTIQGAGLDKQEIPAVILFQK